MFDEFSRKMQPESDLIDNIKPAVAPSSENIAAEAIAKLPRRLLIILVAICLTLGLISYDRSEKEIELNWEKIAMQMESNPQQRTLLELLASLITGIGDNGDEKISERLRQDYSEVITEAYQLLGGEEETSHWGYSPHIQLEDGSFFFLGGPPLDLNSSEVQELIDAGAQMNSLYRYGLIGILVTPDGVMQISRPFSEDQIPVGGFVVFRPVSDLPEDMNGLLPGSVIAEVVGPGGKHEGLYSMLGKGPDGERLTPDAQPIFVDESLATEGGIARARALNPELLRARGRFATCDTSADAY